MAVIGSIVKARGSQYFVSNKRHLGREGNKLAGQFLYTLVDAQSDEYEAVGFTIGGNTIVTKKV